MMIALHIIVICLAAFIVAATLLPFSTSSAWQIRLFDFPRLQLFVLGLLVFAGYLVGWGWREALGLTVLIPLGIALAYQGARMVQYTRLYPKLVKASTHQEADRTIRFVVSNVLMENRDADAYFEVLDGEDPDVILAVETDTWWQEQMDAHLCERYPNTLKCPLPNTYGMLLYTRLPIEEPEIRFMVEDEVPSMWMTLRLPSGEAVRFVGIHPRPPRPDIQQDSDQRDAELILIARELADDSRPTLVAGDLNDVAWSHTSRLFQRIGGMLDPRLGRGLYSTFSAEHWWMRWPLDHIFITEHFRMHEMRRLGYVGSDHFPVFAAFTFEPENKDAHTVPTADAADREDAAHMVSEGIEKADATDRTGSEGVEDRIRRGEPHRQADDETLERAEDTVEPDR